MDLPRWSWFVLMALACDEATPTTPNCETPECRQEAVLEAWTEGNEQGLASLEALPNELERLAAISEVISRYPARVGPLCSRLSPGPTHMRCRRAANRNHLHVQPAEVPSPSLWPYHLCGSKGDCTRGWFRSDLFNPPAALEEVQPDAGSCQDVPDPTSCLISAAQKKVTTGTMLEVAALCKAIPSRTGGTQQWQSECFFLAAESMMKSPDAGGYASAVDLCNLAGAYLRHCHRHLGYILSGEAPVADANDPAAWTKVTDGVQLMVNYWDNKRVGAMLASETWATAIELSVHEAENLSGDLIDQTPPDALPHLRASLAARLLSEGNALDKDLEAWARDVERLLAVRVGRRGATRHVKTLVPPNEAWPTKLALEAGLPIIRYRGPRVRVKSEDSGADTRICLLEAAARLKPPAHHLLKQGVQHSAEEVRWTAESLLAHLDQAQGPPSIPPPGANR